METSPIISVLVLIGVVFYLLFVLPSKKPN